MWWFSQFFIWSIHNPLFKFATPVFCIYGVILSIIKCEKWLFLLIFLIKPEPVFSFYMKATYMRYHSIYVQSWFITKSKPLLNSFATMSLTQVMKKDIKTDGIMEKKKNRVERQEYVIIFKLTVFHIELEFIIDFT